MSTDIKPGDIVRLRKPHPCGSYEWEVVRVGIDVGLRCRRCQRQITLKRSTFEKRLSQVTPRD